MSDAENSVIPLFPLHTVLFPGGPLPLRIFETRYTDMVRRCMREQQPFGVVLIQEGEEAGPVATTATVGCSARIADFYTLQDGLLGISCVGERKFRVQRVWRAADGLNMGEVSWLAPEPQISAAGGVRAIRRRPCGARSTSSPSTTSTWRRNSTTPPGSARASPSSCRSGSTTSRCCWSSTIPGAARRAAQPGAHRQLERL